MNFQGTGKRLQAGDVGKAAKQIGIETAVLLAFLEVEAAGRGFDNFNRPKMLFEPHVFWRNLTGALRSTAARLGLAYARWKPGNYPRESYTRLQAAIDVAEEPAFLSASYGLGQIMGFNHAIAGNRTAKEMFETAKKGEFEQLVQLVTLMKSWRMNEMLRPGLDYTNPETWVPAVRKYNGSGFRKNNYHVKAANAFKKHSGQTVSVVNRVSSVLKLGSKGEPVRNLQADLETLGYTFNSGVDGRFGPETEKHVKGFQNMNGLTVDGYAGENTLKKIAQQIETIRVDKSPELPAFDKQTPWLSVIAAILKGLFK